MHRRITTAVGTAVLVAGAATALTTAPVAAAASPAPIPTVTVHMSSSQITLSTGHHLHAGRVRFKVVTNKGDHGLQILRLRNGYTPQQAGQDINKAFGGDVAAVRRVDRNIVFRGGIETRPSHPGWVSVSLPAGQFFFLDQESNAATQVTVSGTAPQRQTLPNRGLVTVYSYGFVPQPSQLPTNSWIVIDNHADQPHFVEFQHVKSTTTNSQVRRALSPNNRRQPPWLLKGSLNTGVLTQGQHQSVHLDLPAGKYLVACFWPDWRTGMPHAFMGMWRLIWLR